MATALPARKLILASAILLAGTILAAAPSTSKAQGLYGCGCGGSGWSIYPSWGYAVGMPGYYSDFRAQSYYAAPWIAGYEAPWYSPGCDYGYGLGYGYGGAGRYPWIWNRHAGFVTRGYAEPSPPASIKVVKNPFYKPGESSPSDAPKTTATEVESKARFASLRILTSLRNSLNQPSRVPILK